MPTEWFERSDHIEAAKSLFRSRVVKSSVSTAISLVDLYYSEKSYTKYMWYAAYSMTAIASLPILFTGTVLGGLSVFIYHGVHRLVYGHYSSRFFGVLLDIRADKNTDISFGQKIAIFAANILASSHTDLFNFIKELDSSVDKILGIAIIKIKEASGKNIQSEKVEDQNDQTKEDAAKNTFLSDILEKIKTNKDTKDKALDLLKTIIAAAQIDDIKSVIDIAFKKEAKTDDIIATALPLVTQLLSNDDIRNGISLLLQTGTVTSIIIEAYKFTDAKESDVKFLENILSKVAKDATVIPQVLQLANNIITQVETNEITAIIEAAKGEKIDEIIAAALPLVTKLLSNNKIKANLNALLKDETLSEIILDGYVHAGAEENDVTFLGGILTQIIKDENAIPDTLSLAKNILWAPSAKSIIGLFNAISDQKDKNDNANLSIIHNYLEVLKRELSSIPVKIALTKILTNKALLNIAVELYRKKLPQEQQKDNQKKVSFLIETLNKILEDANLMPQVLQLAGDIITQAETNEITAIIEAAKGEKIDEIIAAALPLVTKLLSNNKVQTNLNILLRDETLNKVILDGYTYAGAEEKDIAFLGGFLTQIIKNTTLIPQILQLAKTIITKADIMPAVSVALKNDANADDIIEAVLPIATKLLSTNTFKIGINKLLQNAILIKAYKFSNPKAKVEEITLIIELLKGPIAQTIDLCGAILKTISIPDVSTIYEAFNTEESKDFLAGGEDAPALPVSIITACIPLAKQLLGSRSIIVCIKDIITNQQLDTALKNFLGEGSDAYKNFVLIKNNFDEIFSFASALLNSIDSQKTILLLNEINVYIKERKISQQDPSKKEAKIDGIIATALSIVNKLLSTDAVKRSLHTLLQHDAINEIIIEAYKLSGAKEDNVNFLGGALSKIAKDVTLIPQILQLAGNILTQVKHDKIISLVESVKGSKTDEIIAAALPLVTKLLYNNKVQTNLNTLLRDEILNEVILDGYAYAGAEENDIAFLRGLLTQIIKNTTLMPQVLQLTKTIITNADIMPAVSVALKNNANAGDIIEAVLPIATKLLSTNTFKIAINSLLQNAIIIEVYKFSNPKAKVEEITLITELLKGPIAKTIDLCEAILKTISIPDVSTIYEAFNTQESKDFLAGGEDAPALPVSIITACIPLAKQLFGSPIIVACIKDIITNQQLDTALKNFLGEGSDAYKNFVWAKNNFDGIISFTAHLLSEVDLQAIQEILNEINACIKERKTSDNLQELDNNFIIGLFSNIAEDKARILSAISGSENLTLLVNSYIKSFYSDKVPLIFTDLEGTTKLIPPLLRALNNDKDQFAKLIDVVLGDIYKASTMGDIDKLIDSYTEAQSANANKLEEDLTKLFQANKDKSYFIEILAHITEIDKPGSGKYQPKDLNNSANIKILAEALNKISSKLAPEEKSGAEAEENAAKAEKNAAEAEDMQFNAILETVKNTANTSEFKNLCKHFIKNLGIRDSKSSEEVIKIDRDQKLLEIAQYFFGNDSTYASIPHLVDAMQKYAAWKKSTPDNKYESAQECYESVKKFLKELQAILGGFTNISNYNELVADLLHEVIPDDIKYYFAFAGHDVDSLIATVFTNTSQVTALLPTVTQTVLGIYGLTSTAAAALWSSPKLITKTLANLACATTTSATDLLSQILLNHDKKEAGLNHDKKVDFKEVIKDHASGQSDDIIKRKILTGNFRGSTYYDLEFKNLTVTRLDHNCAVSLDRSNITNLKFTNSEISRMTVIGCAVYNMTIKRSTVTNLDFSNIIRKKLIIKNSTLDAKTFVSLIKCAENAELKIEGIKIKGSLDFACEEDQKLLDTVKKLRNAHKPSESVTQDEGKKPKTPIKSRETTPLNISSVTTPRAKSRENIFPLVPAPISPGNPYASTAHLGLPSHSNILILGHAPLPKAQNKGFGKGTGE
ncbi:MAG: hypothetical protein K0R73_202 [Candidatus Midichloriaceae bacterium]|jgi:hypothetical protein|nr:hypothetical protein [Candidatus Midichloriaceae bacterium]